MREPSHYYYNHLYSYPNNYYDHSYFNSFPNYHYDDSDIDSNPYLYHGNFNFHYKHDNKQAVNFGEHAVLRRSDCDGHCWRRGDSLVKTLVLEGSMTDIASLWRSGRIGRSPEHGVSFQLC
ncbi:hypothetical protein M501DRAFT_147098 [Patellaria atrata CBS 101060]|uniref:Uncharacterized protein n=1 Tax=Patellaria atrata CBS 101060 TaxID=1346257 RepID=A0A9P4S9V3_9PEZI|nr:hypothetical protein M501DRAFT_147098 [Patellaria atrata CBS 101060]